MAADQRRKGLNGAAPDVSLREKPRGKKKQAVSTESNGFRVKPRVSLEWDANRKRVVAKREQIGLSWRNLRPFVEPLPHGHKILADAFDVPTELFKLENIEDVLSHEVWQTCLSERERRFLTHFLPGETEPQQAVKQLLGGENFHFGNPFLDWAASLQSGNLHPDAVVHREQSLKAAKSAYYSELHRYHNDMIGSLLKMKESWQNSKDFEKEPNRKTMRSKKDKEKKFSRVDEFEICDLDNSFAGTSKSSSLGTEEKTSNSDEPIESFKKAGESRKRISKKRPIKDRGGDPPIASDDVLIGKAMRRKSVKVTRKNVVYHDGTEYMSYVKISKKQHKLAKSMEESGSSMQSRSLGNLKNLHIQPYKVFVEEQQKKLHDHWLRLANHDLPSAYGFWNEIRIQRRQMMRSLEQELLERHDSLLEDVEGEIPESEILAQKDNEGIDERLTMKEDKESPLCSSHDQQNNSGADYASSMEDDDESTAPGLVNDQRGDDGKVDEQDQQFVAENHDEALPCSDVKVGMSSILDHPGIVARNNDTDSVPGSSQDLLLNQPPSSSSGDPNFNHVGLESEILRSGPAPQDVSPYSGNLNGADLIDIDRVPLSQGGDMWQPVSSVSSMPLPYFDSSSTGCQFNSVAEIPLPPSLSPIDGEQRAPQWIELESNLHGQAQQLHRDSNSFGSYAIHRDQNELLQSIFSSQQGMLHPGNSNNQQKHMGPLNFQIPNNVLTETYGQRMQNSIQQNMSTGSMLPSGGGNRFLMQQRQQEHHLLPPSVSIQEWAHHVPSTIQPPPPVSGQNWFSNSNEHQVRGGGWASSSAGPSQTNNLVMDQSMYGVLPHCNQLSSRHPSYDSIEQVIPSRSYGHGLMSGPGIGNVLPHQPGPSLDYMNRRDDDTGWMSLPPHQNSSMNDSMDKPPFLGSWNQ
ncbi:hypothetical protein CDL15_Pgr028415 [Punica granatum]|uniref:DEUBAD domain-containing protein n=2 Tax=Punica granatum TaxID=22663 RepID=A0A218W644_PUNGR|nr:hypothetical protein CDL15_Pgr028415 [Punica granatum]